ncbi:MAG: acyltransferase family protein [Lachnospiraceae bacterium]|nr:acyltransferase family protein [Lachnospiraceae bacterium]
MSSIKNNRNIKIEIIRLIACMAVIWYHVRELPWKSNGELSETAVFFECICTICVMTFFLITGFFIYNKKGSIIENWLSLIKKFFKQIFIFFILVSLFTIVFHDFLISKESFVGCIANTSLEKIGATLFDTFRHFSANYLPGTAAHLWYIFSYAIIIIAYPITKFVIDRFPRLAIYIILVLLTICMVINDYYLFYGNPSYNLIFKIIHKPIYYSLWGYVLYNDIIKKYIDEKLEAYPNKNNVFIINKPIFFISFILYAVTFVLLFKTQVAYDLGTNGEYVYTSWLSTYSLFLTTAFVLFVYNLNLDRFLNDKINNAIYYLSSKTLGIYMIHYLIITKFLSIGFQSRFTNNRPNIFYHLAYYIFYSLFIFIVSFALVFIIDFVVNKIKSLILKR